MNTPDNPIEVRLSSYTAIPADEVTATDAAESIGSIAKRLRTLSWTLHFYADVLKDHDALSYEGSAAMDAVLKLEGVADDLAKLPAKVAYHLANPPTRWDCPPGAK